MLSGKVAYEGETGNRKGTTPTREFPRIKEVSMTIKTSYLVDEKGQKKSVVLAIEDYLRLCEYLLELEDAVDLKKAKEPAKKFIDFEDFVAKVKKHGRIH